MNLPDTAQYMGHCFRRTSASILANTGANQERIRRHGNWRSDKVANGYVEDSIYYKTDTNDFITFGIDPESDPPAATKNRTDEQNSDAQVPKTNRTEKPNPNPPVATKRRTDEQNSDAPFPKTRRPEKPNPDPPVPEQFVEPQMPLEETPEPEMNFSTQGTSSSSVKTVSDSKNSFGIPQNAPFSFTLNNCSNFEIHFNKS